MNPLKKISKWFRDRKQRKQIQNKITAQAIAEYNELIQEFRRIQEKRSTLSANQRRKVEQKIFHLIEKGHITVKS